MRLYNYIFYRIYQFANRRCKVDTPELTAIIAITLLFIFNILSISRILDSLYNIGTNDYIFYLCSILIFIVNCIYYYRKRKYKDIVTEFLQETKSVRVISSILVTGYALFTLCFFIYAIEAFKI